MRKVCAARIVCGYRHRALAAAVLLVAGQALAGNDTWKVATNGYFEVGSQWTDGSAPTAGDSVTFNRSGTYNVWWDSTTGNRTTMGLTLSGGNVSFGVVMGGERTWTIHDSLNEADARIDGARMTLGLRSASTADLVLQIDDALLVDNDGELTVTSGGRISAPQTQVGVNTAASMIVFDGGSVNSTTGTIGAGTASGAISRVTVDGAGSTWASTGNLVAGDLGASSLVISYGARVSNAAGYINVESQYQSNVAVIGTGSRWENAQTLYVGYGGEGRLFVEEGGEVTSGYGAIMGMGQGSTGTVSVDGAGSKLTSDAVTVGWAGSGNLVIANGGQVVSSYGEMGYMATGSGEVTVTGRGSKWTISGEGSALLVGDVGHGSLQIVDGGEVSATKSTIGDRPGATGSVTVDSAGMWTNSSTLEVGVVGDGTLSISNGGQVRNTAGTIATWTAGTGDVTVDGVGSLWENSSTLVVAQRGGGTLTVSNGGRVSNTDGSVGVIGGAYGTVSVEGDGSKWSNSGSLAIGGSATATGGAGNVFIGAGGEVEVGTTLKLWADGSLDLAGGTLRLHNPNAIGFSGGALNYYFGTVAYDCDVAIGAGRSQVTHASLFGSAPTIPTGKALEIGGKATLYAPLTINGGTFSAGSLVNASLLQFSSGTLNLTASTLAVGTGGLFGDTLQLTSGKHVNVTEPTQVLSSGLLIVGDGASFASRDITNGGEIVLGGGSARVDSDLMWNGGLIRGDGRISSQFENAGGGEVRVNAGQRLAFSNWYAYNSGLITVDHGQMDFMNLSNNGQIDVTDGALKCTNGLANFGTLNLHNGSIYGGVYNGNYARINIGGGTTPALFDSVQNWGTVMIGTGAVVSFYSDVSGAGSYVGAGVAEFLGSYSPGASPAQVQLSNVAFATTNTLVMEIAGTEPGTGYDQLILSGTGQLGGILRVDLLDGYAPKLGDQFLLITGGTISGSFTTMDLPVLANGYDWSMTQNSSGISLQVVPEPIAFAAIGVVAFGLLLRTRREA